MEFFVTTEFIADWNKNRLTELGMVNFHPWTNCLFDDCCVIHKPSSHHMIFWPMSLDYWHDMGLITRYCPHGRQHPDPDAYNYWVKSGKRHIPGSTADEMIRHEYHCDGCCKSHSVRYITVADPQ